MRLVVGASVPPVWFVGAWFACVGVWPFHDPGHGLAVAQLFDLLIHACGCLVVVAFASGARFRLVSSSLVKEQR